MEENAREGTVTRAVIGNHEFVATGGIGNQKSLELAPLKFLEYSGYETYDTHMVMGGYHFIFLNMDMGKGYEFFSDEKLDWLKNELDKAIAEDPTKHIFLFRHVPPNDTCFGSNRSASDKKLRSLLDNYPQVVDFAGHTHANVADPRSIWQGSFTVFNTGSMAYLTLSVPGENGNVWTCASDEEGGYGGKGSISPRNGGMYYIVEINEEGVVQVLIYDIFTDSVYGEPIILDTVNPDEFVYTDDRAASAVKPEFADGVVPTALSNNYKNMLIQFPQATCKDVVQGYRVEVYKDETLAQFIAIGADSGDGTVNNFFKGNIAIARIYSEALNAEQIMDSYADIVS